VLTTHVNADGDGAGSEVAMLRWLEDRGVEGVIVNPTPFPDAYGFLLEGTSAFTPHEAEGRNALRRADVILVLDTSERHRLGEVAGHLDDTRVAVVDHHPPGEEAIADVEARDPGACATGELVHDLIRVEESKLTLSQARALYVAVTTDTGSFRFGNTSPRTHEIAAALLRHGVDVQEMYRRLYGRFTPAHLALLRRALETLETTDEGRVAWIVLRHRDLEDTGATPEDREGIVEYARRLRGVEVALLFRELPDGRCKISLRSNGPADVSAVAREFGGGGHVKASGALVEVPLETAVEQVRGAVVREVRRVI